MTAITDREGWTTVIVPPQPGQMGIVAWSFEVDDGLIEVQYELMPVVAFAVRFDRGAARSMFAPDVIVPWGENDPDQYIGLVLPSGAVAMNDELFPSIDAFVRAVREDATRRSQGRAAQAAAA